jgi:hypothetical protein
MYKNPNMNSNNLATLILSNDCDNVCIAAINVYDGWLSLSENSLSERK